VSRLQFDLFNHRRICDKLPRIGAQQQRDVPKAALLATFPALGRLNYSGNSGLVNMMFASREEAGQELGRHLRDKGVEVDCVLGLPRGGVVVAAQVARLLQRPLDVLIVRKIGHPSYREFAVGALAEPDVILLNEASMHRHLIARSDLDEVIAEETQRLRQYQTKFHRAGAPDLNGKAVLLVDDGLATGATTEAAVLASRKLNARKVVVAAPVASTSAVERLGRVADGVIALLVDPGFEAVGQYYDQFAQTSDEEVLALLEAFKQAGT
jgi:putative phosphoribosyl transferase